MKKVLIFGLIVGGFALTSCKKDWTCTCTSDDGQGNTTSSSTTIQNATKSDAEAACNSTATSGSYTVTCAIEE
ncbi:MAG: hypothetical protein HUJ25_08085 [Crocinitomicaceae bacterium]|nr:hypothetical protein [Crocinitomicaceae bacterium]